MKWLQEQQQQEVLAQKQQDKDAEIDTLRKQQEKSNQQIADLSKRLNKIMSLLPTGIASLEQTWKAVEYAIGPAYERKKKGLEQEQQQGQQEQ